MQVPELRCMEPENYKKYFRALCWSGTKKERRSHKRIGKKEKLRRLKAANALAVCYAPALLGNPSQFAVYANVRKSILARWRHLHGTVSELSDDSDTEDASPPQTNKIPKITGIGLRSVFSLIEQARFTNAQFCEHALIALLDVLQGHAPEELSQEPTDIIINLHSMLVEVASGSGPNGKVELPTNLTALSSSCLIALSVARGEAELILSAVASLIMSSSVLSEQDLQIPSNLITLQRSVQSVILGSPSRNLWLNYGVPHQCLVNSFPVDLPAQLTGSGELVVRSLVSDGCFLYVYTSKGLLKIGSGYGSSIRQHVYLHKPDFFASDRHGWLGYCKNKLYLRIGRKKTEVYEIDRETLEVRNMIRLDPGQPAPVEPKSAVFTDGNQLGLILLTNFDNLTIRLYDADSQPERDEGTATTTLTSVKEINVHLLRRRTLVLGRSPFDDGMSRRAAELDTPVAMQLDDNDDDPLLSIYGGQDFALLTTASGKVAVGHEGVHAILVLDNGSALFTGIARRGEDGDAMKHRRQPKPTRPKKIFKAEGHFVVYAACNYGSTALVTRQGHLLMFGKDTQHCDSAGQVLGLRHERIVQVALGKAHAVALTNFGQVYTFGINNKGQCGREFGYTKEKMFPSSRRRENKEESRLCSTSHTWTTDYCRVKCGCGEGDSGCAVCGVCRRCADAFVMAGRPERSSTVTVTDLDDDGEPSIRPDSRSDKENVRFSLFEGAAASSEMDRDASLKVTCLPPARVAVPGGHRIVAVACGLHHTVLLTEHGDVLTFGSNQYGQLGAGDIAVHHRIVRVRVPKASSVAAGSNHTAVLTREGELYTFGSYQKGSLGRPRMEEPLRSDRSPIWYATPGRVPRLGPRHSCKAVWVSASGDQTFVQVSQALIKTDTLFSSTITANSNTIIILPNRPEHTFKCITINKIDGSCNTWTGSEQVDFVNSLACLDPLYDVLWCYQPQMRVMKCYNILAFDSHKLQKCCNDPEPYFGDGDFEYPNYGSMKRLEDFKNLENFDLSCRDEDRPTDNVALSNMSVLNQELAIPSAIGSPILPVKEDYQTVNRFESNGGGWGYSGHSVEAIRFMCDTDILLGGIGLYGGRGDYTAKVKLYDIGIEGGDQEGDGELLTESDEIIYECPPRDRFPVMFDNPVPLAANRWYVAWACISGPSSDCGSSGQAMVINDEIGFHFKTSKKSNNGTDVNAGQIPCFIYNTVSPDQTLPLKVVDLGEPIIVLSKNLSRKVTVSCFKSLITLLQWSWDTFKQILLETNGLVPINYQKLTVMKHQKRLVYVIRACLRLVKSYINEIYPQNNRKRNSHEYMSYFEAIAEVRNLIQTIMADQTPTCSMLPRKPGKTKAHRVCYVQFALELITSILNEAHDTITACFHAFFPTPTLKWNHLCSMLFNVKIIIKEIPAKSATVPRSSHAQKPPPIPPRANSRDATKAPDTSESKPNHADWHLLDVIPRLLDIVLNPIKQQMMTRQCGQPHDHGEIKQQEKLSEYCCKLIARIQDTDSNVVKNFVTPSRFMRVNQSRAWNTGNGSPDAICFTVDRPGVTLVGVCVYGGLGNYEYSLELLHDVREDLRYAIRLCNHGGRTSNGDCGLPSVKGPDGTTFRFASCSLSFNGTTLARGQIPSLVYYGSSKNVSNSSESADNLLSSLRSITLRVASTVMERGADLFCTLRNELTAEDLRRNATVLQSSPAINILIPYTLANLEGVDDSKSVIKILEMIHKLLPHVAAMNLLVPSVEETSTTTGHYYTWLESDHPYKQATVTNMRVLFPTNVSWVVLEMDPRSITAQPEDSLTIYAVAGTPKHRCHCANEVRVSDPPFRKRLVQLTNEGEVEELGEEPDGDGVCMHYNCTYVGVTPRLANNASDWPQKAILVPGNEVIFSLETASDYLTEFNKSNNEDNRFGFRCLCVGYEDTPLTTQRQATLVEVQVQAMMGGSPMGVEGESPQDGSEALLLSRGLELSSPPTIHQVLDGQPLLR
ncbi:hypothetical protein HF086_008703 [Spodoptera exigua]|uniref:PHR domain-containing protein n=1 Tax=Spodoptera exigua TaxID=7107 RepID=A0A922MWR7_SPOEX|nr:hypothetical protein HF086_008703 [Spodoptera exigua]